MKGLNNTAMFKCVKWLYKNYIFILVIARSI